MKVLVAVVDYPKPDGSIALMYVHVRNKYYVQNGIHVTVLNFSSHSDYEFDGISVISLAHYKQIPEKYDALICHASNIRNHYRFLNKFNSCFSRIFFFFHGHEILKIHEVYPAPYPYVGKQSALRIFLQNRYDSFKLYLWRKLFIKYKDKCNFVFVSNWLYQRFLEYTKISAAAFAGRIYIIHNSVGSIFEENRYCSKCEKKYDFIIIRSNLDESTYCIDFVNALACRNPDYKFLVVGKGAYFLKNQKALNIEWINRSLLHREMLDFLDLSRCGLMLTRHDTQGVMACEMATYGLPLITSDIAICHEIFSEFPNVAFIKNDIPIDLTDILNQLTAGVPYPPNDKYCYQNTAKKEIDLLKGLLE